MCNCYDDEFQKEVYEFTYIDSSGEVNHMHKETDCVNGTIEDVLYQMKSFLLMCGFEVNELKAINDYGDFSSDNF